MQFESIEKVVDSVISEVPYVKILSIPKKDENGEWTALAQVNETLAIVSLKVTKINGHNPNA